MSYLKPTNGGCFITINTSPGAARTEVAEINEWRGALHIRVAAEARNGAANQALVTFLSERLSIPADSVRIVKGAKSSMKIVRVPLSAENVEAILGGG